VTIHVVGAGGMLGQDILRAAGDDAVALTRGELDVTDAAAVREALAGSTVINCAAYTNVDGAEADPAAAHAVNADGARNVALAAKRVLYVSTDYVFDGTKAAPYVESDQTAPLQEYGHSKLAGERATAEANEDHLVVRSSWLFGAGGRNFVETMLALGRGRDGELLVVDDQLGSPTFTGHLAEALAELAHGDERGTMHVAGAGSCSWFEFAREIFERTGVDADLRPCSTEEFPRPARRPANSVLASERGAPELAAWQDGLDAYLGVRL
jgi:dTDP-4-dehydrorhamnose reductase